MHSGFPDLRDQLSMDFARRAARPTLRSETARQIERVIEAWSVALKTYAGDGGFLFGRFCIADCMYAPVVSRFVTYDVALPAIAKAYRDRIFALPTMQEWRRLAAEEVAAGLA